MKTIVRVGIYILLIIYRQVASGELIELPHSCLRSNVYEGLKKTNDPVGQSVDFSTGFELTIQFTGQFDENAENGLEVEMNMITKDGEERKYRNSLRVDINKERTPPVIFTGLECSLNMNVFDIMHMRNNRGFFDGNTFDGKTHTLTIRERQVSDNRFIVLNYIDNILAANYDLSCNGDSTDWPISKKGNFKINVTGNGRIINYEYKKTEDAKRYFLTFASTTQRDISGTKMTFRTADGKLVENNTTKANGAANIGDYLLLQWTVLNGRNTTTESWGYWPDPNSDVITVGKQIVPLSYNFNKEEGNSVFRCEVTEEDYYSSIRRRSQWMEAPGLYFFTNKRCISLITSIMPELMNSVYQINFYSQNSYMSPNEFIATHLEYPHAEQELEIEEMYYPLSTKDLTLTIESSVTPATPIDMSTRLGAYIGTSKFKPGTVGYGVNLGIGIIKWIAPTGGQAKIGDFFNRPDIQALLALENTPENNRKVAVEEFNYWKSIRDDPKQSNGNRVGGAVGTLLLPGVRQYMSMYLGNASGNFTYAVDNFIDPRLLNIRDQTEQLQAVMLYRIELLKLALKEKLKPTLPKRGSNPVKK